MIRSVLLTTRGCLVVLAAGLCACASPPSRFYTLAATAQADGSAPATYSVAIDNVSVPATVDRPQFVVQLGPNRVAIDEFNRWAAPLGASVARAVAENLVILLATPRVGSGFLTASLDPAYRVTIDIQRFESVAGDSASFDALWVIRGKGVAQPISGRTTLREAVAGSGYDALAAAHSRAIAAMSRDLALAIRAEAVRQQR